MSLLAAVALVLAAGTIDTGDIPAIATIVGAVCVLWAVHVRGWHLFH